MKKIIFVALASLALSGCSFENPFKKELKCVAGESPVDGKCVVVEQPKPVVKERIYNTVENSFKGYLESLYTVNSLKLYCENSQADGDQLQGCTATFESGVRERLTVKAQCYLDGSGCY